MILLLTFGISAADLGRLYANGDYQAIIERAPLILLDTTLSKDEEIEVYKYYAFALVILGRKEEAIELFIRLLDLNPNFQLDPVKISPKIINVFNEAKNRRNLMMPIIRPFKDTIYIEKKLPLAVLVPGVYQIQENKRIKGYIIIAAELISVTALGISQYYYTKSREEYLATRDPYIISEKYEVYNGWYKKRLIFAFTTGAIWLFSLIDAF
ncbi:hypothetical protein DRP53_04875 [candidate division WOR-3 bacterium]|uniref:Tetratricopeptide repeat protein n=1 Tax=candidate division WOR-3 bacterium TaxID=2052148 RepID=A0A660SI74_UNCW3|nr:MAG: hypothetical protein DRP53_04875 [candidate division WOR-3 bacterium]